MIGVESDGSRLRFGNLASQKKKNSNNRHKCQNENHLCPPKVSQKEQHLLWASKVSQTVEVKTKNYRK